MACIDAGVAAEGLTSQERAARVAWHLARGRRLTTKQVAEMTGLSMRGALHLLHRMSRVLPIYQDGDWTWICVDLFEG